MKQKVLLVDDSHESLLPSLRHSLSLETYEVVLAESVQHASAKSDAGEIDLLGRRTKPVGQRIGEVLPTRWIE